MQFQIENFSLLGYVVEKQKDGAFLIATKDFLHAEKEPAFSRFLESINGEILTKSDNTIKPSQIDNLFVSIDQHNTATVIINELTITMSAFMKKELQKGDSINQDDIAHINQLVISPIRFDSKNRFLFLFNVGWQRGICFDLIPRSFEYKGPSEEEFSHWLAQAFSYLAFKKRFLDEEIWNYIFENNFFPFIYLNNNLTHSLIELAKEQNNNFDDLYYPLLFKNLENDLPKLRLQWNKNPIIAEEATFIETAIKHYRDKDYISCLSVIYPRIERILRKHQHQYSVKPDLQQTYDQTSLSNSVKINFDDSKFPYTPLLTDKFSEYLKSSFFKNFVPGRFDEPANRNTIGHGVASEQYFDQKGSTIAFLILNQLYYYLGADGKTWRVELK